MGENHTSNLNPYPLVNQNPKGRHPRSSLLSYIACAPAVAADQKNKKEKERRARHAVPYRNRNTRARTR
jgi:hypothetical protein